MYSYLWQTGTAVHFTFGHITIFKDLIRPLFFLWLCCSYVDENAHAENTTKDAL